VELQGVRGKEDRMIDDLDEPYDDGPSEDEDGYPDCGLGPDGQCSKAGSEECDWECGAAYEKIVEKCERGCGKQKHVGQACGW
jgi:hypothetical protein